jgi:hypothetical protein
MAKDYDRIREQRKNNDARIRLAEQRDSNRQQRAEQDREDRINKEQRLAQERGQKEARRQEEKHAREKERQNQNSEKMQLEREKLRQREDQRLANMEEKERKELAKVEYDQLKQRGEVVKEEVKNYGSVEQMELAHELEKQIIDVRFDDFVKRENVFEQEHLIEYKREIERIDKLHVQLLEVENVTAQIYKERIKEEFELKNLEMYEEALIQKSLIKIQFDTDIARMREEAEIQSRQMRDEAEIKAEEDYRLHSLSVEMEEKEATEDIRKHNAKELNDYVIRKIERQELLEEDKVLFGKFEQEYQEEIKAEEEAIKKKLKAGQDSDN